MGLTDVYKKDVYGLFKYYFGKVNSYEKAVELKTVAQATLSRCVYRSI